MKDKIEGTPQAWETGKLGLDEKYVKKAEIGEASIDEALELQMISIRLPKALIVDLKNFAALEGLGYQPLIKRILKRWVEAEKRAIANNCIAEELEARKAIHDKKSKEESGDVELNRATS